MYTKLEFTVFVFPHRLDFTSTWTIPLFNPFSNNTASPVAASHNRVFNR